MHSWDLFDTLVAARNGGPAGEYLDQLFPIAETIARVRPEDWILSDYYTHEAAERVVRQVAGLSNPLRVTPHGKFEGVLWRILQQEGLRIERHHGDNPTGDFGRPLAAGVPAELITLSQFTELERAMVDFGVPELGYACREARLTTWHPRFRRLQLLQVATNFPALVLAGVALHHFVEQQGARRVLMSARDCCLWVELQRDLCQRLKGQYEVEYFPSSRVCRDRPSARYLQELNTRLAEGAVLVDLAGTGESLARLIANSRYPHTTGFIVSKYPWRYDESVPMDQIHVLTQYFGGGIAEFANSAMHGMYLDWDRTTAIEFDWHREELQVMHAAFQTARRVLWHYDVPSYRPDWLICCLEHFSTQITWGETIHEAGDLSFLAPAFDAEERARKEAYDCPASV